jgi:hypothetical protein
MLYSHLLLSLARGLLLGLAPFRLVGNAKISEKHTVSIFKAEMALFGSGGIFYVMLEEIWLRK